MLEEPMSGRSSAPSSRGLLLVTLVLAVATSGASCPQFLQGYQYGTLPLPRTLPANPTLEQIIQVVHDNTSRVRSYMAPQATLSVPGVPKLSAQVACEPPRRFRLRAQTAVDPPPSATDPALLPSRQLRGIICPSASAAQGGLDAGTPRLGDVSPQ